MNDLNVRAARVLKWTEESCSPSCRMPHHGGFYSDSETYYPKRSLEFTESYNWAMLGVQALDFTQLGVYRNLLQKNIGEIKTIGEPSRYSPREVFQASPLLITRTWVEVLESE